MIRLATIEDQSALVRLCKKRCVGRDNNPLGIPVQMC